ncbi:MAG: hypothetical protein AB3N13_13130 [Arenibacterium sp.]
MTCGACNPEQFRTGGGVVYGYLVAANVDQAAHEARKLYFMGAEHVFADEPKGNVGKRRGFSRLRDKLLRSGDKLILSCESALGTKPHLAAHHFASLEAQGITVAVLRDDYFAQGQELEFSRPQDAIL